MGDFASCCEGYVYELAVVLPRVCSGRWRSCVARPRSVGRSQPTWSTDLQDGGLVELDAACWPWGPQELVVERKRCPGFDRAWTCHLAVVQVEDGPGL
jgi:hypothetical protein